MFLAAAWFQSDHLEAWLVGWKNEVGGCFALRIRLYVLRKGLGGPYIPILFWMGLEPKTSYSIGRGGRILRVGKNIDRKVFRGHPNKRNFHHEHILAWKIKMESNKREVLEDAFSFWIRLLFLGSMLIFRGGVEIIFVAPVVNIFLVRLVLSWSIFTWMYYGPWKLTWNLKIIQLKRNIIFQTSMFGFQPFIFQGVL